MYDSVCFIIMNTHHVSASLLSFNLRISSRDGGGTQGIHEDSFNTPTQKLKFLLNFPQKKEISSRPPNM